MRYTEGITIHLPLVADPDGYISAKFGVEGYATHVIIGKDGNIFNVSSGGGTDIDRGKDPPED